MIFKQLLIEEPEQPSIPEWEPIPLQPELPLPQYHKEKPSDKSQKVNSGVIVIDL